jgi:hypothetical protein
LSVEVARVGDQVNRLCESSRIARRYCGRSGDEVGSESRAAEAAEIEPSTSAMAAVAATNFDISITSNEPPQPPRAQFYKQLFQSRFLGQSCDFLDK